MKARNLIIFIVSAMAVTVVVYVAFTFYWQRKPWEFKEAPKLISAMQAFSRDRMTRGEPLPESVSLSELVGAGYIAASDVRAFEGMDVTVSLTADAASPAAVLLHVRLPDGSQTVLMTDGSVQQLGVETNGTPNRASPPQTVPAPPANLAPQIYHEGVFYGFGKRRIEAMPGPGAQAALHVYSSTNLQIWYDEGVALQPLEAETDGTPNPAPTPGDAQTADRNVAPHDSRDFRPGALWLDNNGVHINAHDGGVLYHEGVYYWFGAHRTEGKLGNTARVGVHVYSSTNLYSWNDEGIALAVSDDPASEIVRGCVLDRPKVIFNAKTGKFVMWFHLEPKGEPCVAATSGVAIADRVTGPYRYLYSLRPNAGVWPDNLPQDRRKPPTPEEVAQFEGHALTGKRAEDLPYLIDFPCRQDFPGGQRACDMTLFVDDDQAAYHIYVSERLATLHISRLADDYLKPAGHYVRILVAQFNEAPAVFKHAGKYFMITSGQSGWHANPALLFSADSIMGEWTFLGNPCVGNELQRKTTFGSQGTFVLPVAGRQGAFIFMADRWRPDNPIDGRYIWLPIQWYKGIPLLQWKERWDLSFFDPAQNGKTPSR